MLRQTFFGSLSPFSLASLGNNLARMCKGGWLTLPAVLTLISPSSSGQAGMLDRSFGGDGMVTTDILGTARAYPYPMAVAVAAGARGAGKIVVAGASEGADGYQVVQIARVLADGTPDVTFDGDGWVVRRFDSNSSLAPSPVPTGIAFDGDAVVVVGYYELETGPHVFALRYLDDGSPDPAFGDGGVVFLDFLSANRAAAGCVVDRGRTYIGGESAIICLDANGALDWTFGLQGIATIPGLLRMEDMAITTSGRIVATGNNASSAHTVIVARLLADGSLDASFDFDGIAIAGFSSGAYESSTHPRGIACAADGTTMVCMLHYLGAPTYGYQLEFVRLLEDGAIDPTFGVNGMVLMNAYRYDTAMTLASDGSTLVTGFDDQEDFTARRLLPSGTLDAGFGDNGEARVVTSGWVSTVGIATDASDNIILVGRGDWSFVLAKLTAAGFADPGFGDGSGVTRIEPLGSGWEYGRDVIAMQGDGKFLVLGQSGQGGVVARHEANGGLDPTFGQAGLAVSQDWQGGVAIAMQPGGRILILRTTGQLQGEVVGLTTDGQLDLAFGIGGRATMPHPSEQSIYMAGMAMLADGSVLLAGNVVSGGNWATVEVVVCKLHANGSPDWSFGTGGFATFHTPDVQHQASSIAVYPLSGKIAVGGQSSWRLPGFPWWVNRVGLGLLDANGTPLTGFTTSIESYGGYPVDVAIDATDRLYLSGGLVPLASGQLAIARLLSDRTLDPTFGIGGIAVAGFGQSGSNILAETIGVTVQADGWPVAIGTVGPDSWIGIDGDFAVARWDMNGSPDWEFGDAGRTTADFGALDYPSAVAIQGDGTILVAGTTFAVYQDGYDYAQPMDIAIARFHGVATPEVVLTDLVSMVESLVDQQLLAHGDSTSLQKKLEASLQQVDNGNTTSAVNQLSAFTNQVNALVTSGRLAAAEAAQLTDWVTTARELILGS